ncbi:BLUF domain-containing protein [Hyphobacterium sp. HN65]|uniref:BLUF domain-containing protein n=1 Tax=Hyphobacterium lacteum TaxID=3116575 RepID=A0ABU7LSJ4_9PROT|nr:BLUF domain-containing protein [Hyphobacterium sp. HN65]MEE2526879.1 BLUF domain-containing protein [Hyphobacterium sp. HN65]
MTLTRMIYVSRAAGALETAEVDDILEAARINNARLDITGLLLFDGTNFMQLLEGPNSDLQSLFETIAADKRHENVIRILLEDTEERQFPGWSMGYSFVEAGHSLQGKDWFPLTHGSLKAALPSRLDPTVRVLFTSFLSVPKAA